MWLEPLTASSRPVDEHTVDVLAHDGRGSIVARVRCGYNARAGCGLFGEMLVVDRAGAPRQRVRALALLVREALRFAEAAGVTRVRTDAPERMAAFASLLSGIEATDGRRRHVFAGELHAVRSNVLRETDAHGNIARLGDDDEPEV
jgi:hypothetical protein